MVCSELGIQLYLYVLINTKVLLLVIDNNDNLQSFKIVNCHGLQYEYKVNEKGLMNRLIIEGGLEWFDHCMEWWKILLMLNNFFAPKSTPQAL